MSRVFTFSGAGNDFVVLDGRKGGMEPFREPARIGALCQQYHTDGLMILTTPATPDLTGDLMPDSIRPDSATPAFNRPSPPDFVMEFYNPDGSGGMMCGNGGRCIVAFADYLGISPADGHTYHFLAPDGPHTAEILEENAALQKWTVRLKMIDVTGITPMKGGYFLNTGTRHFVKFVSGVDGMDMETEAKPLRWDSAFQPEGTNVNLVEVRPDGLHVRTYEKGVEGETLACGTGLTASAIAACQAGISGANRPGGGYRLQCRRGDWLEVEFRPAAGERFTDVYLTGPAEMVPLQA